MASDPAILLARSAPAASGGARDAMRRLARESRVSAGRIPHELGGRPVAKGTSGLHGDSYLLRTAEGLGFFYRKGDGITVEHEPGADRAEEGLWLKGSIHAAIACINGLMPIHASAVELGGQVYAFTGPSGAGKSTLIAGLAGHGLPMYADDTLVLDLSDPARAICLPGHKRLKLTRHALALTGACAQEEVGAGTDKYYAVPGAAPGAAGPAGEPLPLAGLIFLETGDTPAIVSLSGGERIARLGDDHYTTRLFARTGDRTPGQIFEARARLARQVAMWRFVRPCDAAVFPATVAMAAAHLAAASRSAEGCAP